MISETYICNLALARIGAPRINSLTSSTVPAQQCALFYPQDRDALLRMYPWNFAISRAVLSIDTVTPDFEFDYQYIIPSDCLRILSKKNHQWEYRIEGQRLLTDDDEAKIRYIRRIEDPAQFDSTFVYALASQLAMSLCTPLSQDKTLRQIIQGEFNMIIGQAKLAAAIEGNPERGDDLTWRESRRFNITR